MGIEEYGGGQGPRPEVLVVTTNDLPGYRVQEVLGEVFGLTVRSRHLGSQIGAGLKSLVGGELRGLTKTLVETRNQAMERLVEQARARGANAVLAFRFDVTEAADVGTEVCAYGTAVVGGGRRGSPPNPHATKQKKKPTPKN
ncbi:YbjQ family protein, partial [Streptomyces rochei]|uniref:YbjQ family protein n=1 Tax=Streptomyces rochei TaxID=1928 RepID=UPI0036579952